MSRSLHLSLFELDKSLGMCESACVTQTSKDALEKLQDAKMVFEKAMLSQALDALDQNQKQAHSEQVSSLGDRVD